MERKEEFNHSHADRLCSLWAWCYKTIYSNVHITQSRLLFDVIAPDFHQFLTKTKHKTRSDKDDLLLLKKLPEEEGSYRLHEILMFNYLILKEYMQGTEEYVEFIKTLRNTTDIHDLLSYSSSSDCPEASGCFLRFQSCLAPGSSSPSVTVSTGGGGAGK